MRPLFILAILGLSSFCQGQVFFYFEKKNPFGFSPRHRFQENAEKPNFDDIEWTLRESNQTVFFDGYCKTLASQEPWAEFPDSTGCKGVNADRYFSNLRKELGIKSERVMNKRRSKLILNEGFGAEAVPSQQQEKVEQGIDELRTRYLSGAGEAACLDDDSNTIADLGLNCKALQEAFKTTAASEYQFRLGKTPRAGLLVDVHHVHKTGFEDDYVVDGLKLNEYDFRFCKLTPTGADTFQLNCIESAKESPGNQPTLTVGSAQYSCSPNPSICSYITAKGKVFPKELRVLEDGSLMNPEGHYSNLAHLLPVKSATRIYYSTRLTSRYSETPGNRPLNSGAEVLLRWKSEYHYDYIGHHTSYSIVEEWGRVLDLNATLN